MTESFDDFEIVYISTYPPRECGIATFTRDLTTAIDRRISIETLPVDFLDSKA